MSTTSNGEEDKHPYDKEESNGAEVDKDAVLAQGPAACWERTAEPAEDHAGESSVGVSRCSGVK